MLQRLFCITALALCSSAVYAAGSSGGGFSTPAPSANPKTPEQIAASAYKTGLRHKSKAWRLEERAEKAKSEKKRANLLAKAQKQYDKAVKAQAKVLQAMPEHYEAANEMGYALRKTGDFQKAIGAYNYALKLKPDFLEAIEYRGEALLALGYLEETKAAYMRLFRDDPELAAQLMQAIQDWVAAQTERSEDIDAFAQWAAERARLVGFTPVPSATAKDRW